MSSITTLFMTFLVYSVIGWLWESFYCSIKAKHFVYRGFLLGPYCPVYGFGVTAVLLLVPKHYGSLLNLYFNMIVIVTIIEYLTSWLLEKLFKMKLWDYSEMPLNIGGRVAVPVSLFWGIGCLFLIKVIQPIIGKGIQDFDSFTRGIGPVILFLVFMGDVLTTLIFTLTAKKEVSAIIDTSDPQNAAIKEYRLDHLIKNHEPHANLGKIKHYLSQTPHKLLHQRNLHRLIENYPNIRFKK